ncbi:hypothetical protein [Mycobacterium sp. 1165178.9]|nr:hypothetical protein [Mycobacterium sp. 1165178.9]
MRSAPSLRRADGLTTKPPLALSVAHGVTVADAESVAGNNF